MAGGAAAGGPARRSRFAVRGGLIAIAFLVHGVNRDERGTGADQRDRVGAFHRAPQELMQAALSTPAAMETQPTQIPAATSPFAMPSGIDGMTNRASQ